MRRLAKLSAVGIVGFGLGATVPAASQPAKGAPASGTAAATSARETAATAHAAADGGAKEEDGASKTKGAADASSPGDVAAKSSGGGYSWSEKKPRSFAKTKVPKIDPSRPLAQAPSFELRPDGTSVVRLTLSLPTDVKRTASGRRFEYRLKNTQIGVANNMNPLVTAHFATPLERIVLRRAKHDAVLILDLRESTDPVHQLRSEAAGATLEITLPKPTRDFVAKSTKGSSNATAQRDSGGPAKPSRRDKSKRKPTKSGPGPRL